MINKAIILILFNSLALTEWSSCRISNQHVAPISVYSIQASKFQVKDVLDSIVNQDTSLVFEKLTNFIDTFILDRSFCLVNTSHSDSIKFYYYFSGDVKEWFTNVDSALIIFSHLSVKGNTYDSKSLKKLPQEDIDFFLNYFNQEILEKVKKLISKMHRYDIRITNTEKKGRIEGQGVICKTDKQCDTLLLKYIDGGKYTGVPLSYP